MIFVKKKKKKGCFPNTSKPTGALHDDCRPSAAARSPTDQAAGAKRGSAAAARALALASPNTAQPAGSRGRVTRRAQLVRRKRSQARGSFAARRTLGRRVGGDSRKGVEGCGAPGLAPRRRPELRPRPRISGGPGPARGGGGGGGAGLPTRLGRPVEPPTRFHKALPFQLQLQC